MEKVHHLFCVRRQATDQERKAQSYIMSRAIRVIMV